MRYFPSTFTPWGKSRVVFDLSVLKCITDVQQGETQMQRGSRKGKLLIVATMCVHVRVLCGQTHCTSCSASPAAILTKPFYAQQSTYQFSHLVSIPLWDCHFSDPYPYILCDLCENSLHFGQDHGGLRFCSNGNCSLWLSARYVILSPTLCSQWWVWGTQGCKEWSEGALCGL